jgi:hypothetical protein
VTKFYSIRLTNAKALKAAVLDQTTESRECYSKLKQFALQFLTKFKFIALSVPRATGE